MVSICICPPKAFQMLHLSTPKTLAIPMLLPLNKLDANCRNPNLAKCGGEAQHLEKLGIWGCRNPNLAKCGGEAQHLEKLRIWGPPGLPNV
jgi:hypothetical protein